VPITGGGLSPARALSQPTAPGRPERQQPPRLGPPSFQLSLPPTQLRQPTQVDHSAGYLATKGARIEYLHLPDTDEGKVGLDDYLAEHTVDELMRLVKPTQPTPRSTTMKPG